MNQNHKAALEISQNIHEIEDDLDLLLAKVGRLMAGMADYRVMTDLDAHVGQKAINRLSEMQGRMVEARMKAIGTHADLKRIIDTTADFPFDCPDKATREDDEPILRLAS